MKTEPKLTPEIIAELEAEKLKANEIQAMAEMEQRQQEQDEQHSYDNQ